MRYLTALFATIILGGCASSNYMWVKDGASEKDFDKDLAECRYQAMINVDKALPKPPPRNEVTVYVNPEEETPSEAAGKALGKSMGDSIVRTMKIAEMQTLCMQIKGYRRIKINPNNKQ